MRHDVLRKFIIEALVEMRNANVPQQLMSRGRSGKGKEEKEDGDEKEDEVDESSVAGVLGGGGGFTAPLGLDSEDMKGLSAGKKKRKGRRSTARWS